MKKVKLLIVIILISITNLNAQKRINDATIKFTKKSEKLKSAIGWEKNNKTGKWVENKNAIDGKKVPSYWVSHISQNFKWMQFSKIELNNKDYYVFLYERLAGEYKYPSIYKGWEKEKRTYFFILDKNQYNKMKKLIELKTGENIIIKSKMTGYITDKFKILGGEHLYNEDNLLAKITHTIKNESYFESSFILNSQTIDGIDILRFRLPESSSFAEEYMKTSYFEVKTEYFKKLLIE